MFDEDSESSASYLSPDEDEDYSIGSDAHDDEILDDICSREKNKAIREGFSFCPNDSVSGNLSPEASMAGKGSVFATQPASQQTSATKRRISPRRKASAGVTSAIVNTIRGDAGGIDSLSMVIPKKQKFRRDPEQVHQEGPAICTTSIMDPPPQMNPRLHTSPPREKQEKRPVKKRKVSLSPVDSSLTKQPSLQESVEVIELLADDSKDEASHGSWEAQNRDKSTSAPQFDEKQSKSTESTISPSLLAAAKKQQHQHIAKAKKKIKEQNTQQNSILVTIAENKISCQHDKKRKPGTRSHTDDKSNATAMESNIKKPTSKKKTPSKPLPKRAEPLPSVVKNVTIANEQALKNTNVSKTDPSTASSNKTSKAELSNGSKKKHPSKKKQTKKKLTFEDDLLQKMILTCRPYSVKDLIQLMGKTTSEASVNFCLLSLVDKGWVIRKEFSSSKGTRTKELYWANQESKDSKLWAKDCLQLPSPEAIRDTRLELANLQQRQKTVHKEIEVVEATPSNDHLREICETAESEVEQLQYKLNAMKERIAGLTKGGNVSTVRGGSRWNNSRIAGVQPARRPLSTKQRRQQTPTRTPLQLKKKINAMRDEWKSRKRKCMDFVEQLADGMEKKVKDVVNKVLELETDEAENVILPPKHVI